MGQVPSQQSSPNNANIAKAKVSPSPAPVAKASPSPTPAAKPPLSPPTPVKASASVESTKTAKTQSWYEYFFGVPSHPVDTREERVPRQEFKIPKSKQKADAFDSNYDTLCMMPDVDWTTKDLQQVIKDSEKKDKK